MRPVSLQHVLYPLNLRLLWVAVQRKAVVYIVHLHVPRYASKSVHLNALVFVIVVVRDLNATSYLE